jgi:dihydroflavonol-4-reductase
MNTILVTGATGCVGSNLTVELLHRGYTVRAFHRSGFSRLTLKDVDVEHVIGDVRDKSILRRAMQGCDTVFHTAAIVSFERRRHEEQFDINVNGTRNVVELCLKLGVQKFVHTSSVAALGFRTDGTYIDETTEYNWGTRLGYRYSKHRSELEVFKGIERGLNAVILNPSVIIGPRDVYVHGGQIVRDIVRGLIPVYVGGGTNVVGVQDVVAGHIAAAERGRIGERYILGGWNMTFKELFDCAAIALSGRAPFIKAPVWLAKAVGHAAEFIGNVTQTKPLITAEMLATIGKNNWQSIEKAKRELGYNPGPIQEAMRQAYQWYRQNGML